MPSYPLHSTYKKRLSNIASVSMKGKSLIFMSVLSTTPAKGFSAWSDSAVKQAHALSISQRAKLLAESGVVKPRFIIIKGESVIDEASKDLDVGEEPDGVITKVVHFQRHGQGFHNILGDILRDAGVKPDVDSTDPAVNPWLRSEIIDAPLTETGKEQCQGQRERASALNPELVVVSPLLRAIQTAAITFADFKDNSSIPWIAHEGCREELGMLFCNKRRPLSAIQKDYPHLQYWDMEEEDTLFDPSKRESNESKSDRIYDFLVNFVANRPESEIAVVCHSAWLFHMCNAVVDCGDDLELQSWFLTSEVRSIRLTFSKQ
jgi:broad specificity phosphatase PhoE